MKLVLFDITNYILILLGVFAFFMIVDGYGGIEKFSNVKNAVGPLLEDYYEKGQKKSNVRYSDQYLLMPTSNLSKYEKNVCENNVRDQHPCGGTDKYPHICHSMYGKKRISK